MTKPSRQHVTADYIGLKIQQATGAVDVSFAIPGNVVLQVTIPLHGLVRLQHDSQHKSAEAKYQAYLESKRSES